MFPGKFFMVVPMLQSEAAVPYIPQSPRCTKFWYYVYQALVWFETKPALESVKLTAIALVEYEKVPFSVWVRHHFLITTPGVPDLVPDTTGYCLEYLPYSLLGNGIFELRRDDPDVRVYLAMVASNEDAVALEIDFLALVAKLAFRMDAAFEPCSIQHDIGIQKLAGD